MVSSCASFGDNARYLVDLAAAGRPRKDAAAANLKPAKALGLETPSTLHELVREAIEQAFRSAAIDGGEVSLWVRNDRIAMVAACPLFIQ